MRSTSSWYLKNLVTYTGRRLTKDSSVESPTWIYVVLRTKNGHLSQLSQQSPSNLHKIEPKRREQLPIRHQFCKHVKAQFTFNYIIVVFFASVFIDSFALFAWFFQVVGQQSLLINFVKIGLTDKAAKLFWLHLWMKQQTNLQRSQGNMKHKIKPGRLKNNINWTSWLLREIILIFCSTHEFRRTKITVNAILTDEKHN